MARSYANRHASIDKGRTSTGMRRSTVTAAGGRRSGSKSSMGATGTKGTKSGVRRAPRKMGPVRQGGGHPGD